MNSKERADFAVMNISDVVRDRMTYISPGENFHVLPMDKRPNCWKNGKHQGTDTFGRLKLNEPSVTIRTAAYNPMKGKYIHPIEDRGLSTHEMAAIQGFPCSWVFKCEKREKITLVVSGKQIGNAVPPRLAGKRQPKTSH
jgi:DNA (cytosine-5)-methyltransferase 1